MQLNMYEMVFMNQFGDEETIYKLFPDDTARLLQWTLIDVTPNDEQKVLS